MAAGEYAAYFGHALGLTFASQMTKVETLRSESTFGTLMRGLQVWGFQVVNPSTITMVAGIVPPALTLTTDPGPTNFYTPVPYPSIV